MHCFDILRVTYSNASDYQPNAKVTIRPGFSRTVLYFWVMSWVPRCLGFVLDLKPSELPSLENAYRSQYYVLNVDYSD